MNHRGAGVSFLGFALLFYLTRYSGLMKPAEFFYASAPFILSGLILICIGYLVVAELFPPRPRKP